MGIPRIHATSAKTFILITLFHVCFTGVSTGAEPDIVDSVSPAVAAPGDTDVSVTINLDSSLGIPPVPPTSATLLGVSIGSVTAKSHNRDSDYVITAVFDFPAGTPTGLFDLVLEFSGDKFFTEVDAFTVGGFGSVTVTLEPAGAVSAGAKWRVDSGVWQDGGAVVDNVSEGDHTIGYATIIGYNAPADETVSVTADQSTSLTRTYTESAVTLTYPIVDTGHEHCYDDGTQISCPSSGESFYGQDAQHSGYTFSYTDNGDGTVTDNVTGLMWRKTTDTDTDGDIDADDKKYYGEAQTYCTDLSLAGYTDWRLPDIKELYSLIDFRGIDCSSYSGSDTSVLTPFIDNTVFHYNWGDDDAGERLIDSQYASDTPYESTTGNGDATLFGVNFADGRIKGYPVDGKTFYVMCVRENAAYGQNDFTDNGDDTITDNATGLMWDKKDSGHDGQSGMDWESTLAWVAQKNTNNHRGYSDWRLPSAKELQSILDYTRSPDTHGTAAIDPLFSATSITNEAGQSDYPYYWTGTTHIQYPDSGGNAAYISFGRAIGSFDAGSTWLDVHGAGAQRSDPKAPEAGVTYPNSHGPQGDAQRVYNYARLVRDAEITSGGTGTLTVTLSPQGAVDQGAKWSVDDGATWNNGGDTITLDAGGYTVTYNMVSGYNAPVDENITVTDGGDAETTGTYTEQTTYTTDDAGCFLKTLAGMSMGDCGDADGDTLQVNPGDTMAVLQYINGPR